MTSPNHRRNRHKRRLSTCRRHPTAQSTADLCASCLRERLNGIQNQSPSTSSDVRTRSNPDPDRPPSTSKSLLSQYVEDEEKEAEDSKTMKEFIDLELGQNKSSRSLFGAASVFSNKLRQWTRKQRKKDEQSGHGFLRIEGPESREIREAISEVAEYAFGRRSIDADPRFSLDIGRLSAADFDAPRASWDGYLIGKINQRNTQMVAADDEPAQTRYCNGGSVDLQRQRRTFDRSVSVRKMSSLDELKSIRSKELIKENQSPLKDFALNSVEYGNKDDDGGGVANGGGQKGFDQKKSSWQWKKVLSFSGFKQNRKEKRSAMEDKGAKTTASESRNGMLGNVTGRDEVHDDEGSAGHGSLVECLQKLRMLDAEGGGDVGDRGSKRIVGNGTQTLAESLQKLRIMAKGDENESCKRNEENLESLQKLRMVRKGGSPAEPLQKPRRVVINVSSNDGAPICEKLVKNNGYLGARKSCDGYIDAGCEKPNTQSNGYIGWRKSCDGYIEPVCEKLSMRSNEYIGTGKSCDGCTHQTDRYTHIVCEKLNERSNGYIGTRKSCDECVHQTDRYIDPVCEKLDARSNGYIGARKSCDEYIDIVCEKLIARSNGYIGARKPCDGYTDVVCEKLDAQSNGYVDVRKSCDGYIDVMCEKPNSRCDR